jgi:hypothetical protein
LACDYTATAETHLQEPQYAFGLTPDQALLEVREDIAHLRAAATWSSCVNQHAAIHKFCRKLFHKRVISAPQLQMLRAEADAEFASWKKPP